MSKLAEKVQVSRLLAPVKFGNIWEHLLKGHTSKDIIFLKIYAKQPELFSRGFGIIYILKHIISMQESKDFVSSTSVLNWVEETKSNFIERYEIVD